MRAFVRMISKMGGQGIAPLTPFFSFDFHSKMTAMTMVEIYDRYYMQKVCRDVKWALGGKCSQHLLHVSCSSSQKQ
jgi:hypothetical protein